MVIVIIQIGKTDNKNLEAVINDYLSRIRKMIRLEVITVPDLKNRGSLSVENQKKEEAVRIMKHFRDGDHPILLDEGGDEQSSRQLADFILSKMNTGCKRLLFIIGGPWGIHNELYSKAGKILTLSKMTFRALTIINGIPYHND